MKVKRCDMKKQILFLYLIESILLVIPIMMIEFYLTSLQIFAIFLPISWYFYIYFLFIPIYMFLVITTIAKFEQIKFNRKHLYNFDNTIFITLSTVISIFVLYFVHEIEDLFLYILHPFVFTLLFILIFGPVITYFLPYIKLKKWAGIFYILLFYLFTSLVYLSIFLLHAGGSV